MRLCITEILLILVLALVVFGGGKLAGVGKALGQSIREFKKEVGSDKKDTDKGDALTKSAENRESPTEEKGEADTAEIDYERLANEDLLMLKEEFSELSEIKSIIELENPIRYGALRDLGLSPREAYLASSKPTQNKRDNRAHLEGSVPKGRSYPRGAISDSDMTMARELFEGISDAEIRKLYRKVTQ